MTEAECTCDEMADGNDCPACALGLVEKEEEDEEQFVGFVPEKTYKSAQGNTVLSLSEDGNEYTDIEITSFDYDVSDDLRHGAHFDSSGTFRFRWSDHPGDSEVVWSWFAPPCVLSDMIIRSNDRTLYFECVGITDFGTIATDDGDIVYEGDFVAPGRPGVTLGDERLVGL